MNEIEVLKPMLFQHQMFGDIRGVDIDNEPWLIGKDVALALDFKNHSAALKRHVDSEDKREGVPLRDPLGKIQNYSLINESGMYSLILGATPKRRKGETEKEFEARKNRVKEFKRWVTHDVLPSIRKNGLYVDPNASSYNVSKETYKDLLQNTNFAEALLDGFINQKSEITFFRNEIAAKDKEIEELKPKAEYTDKVLNSDKTYNIRLFAKWYGMSSQAMNNILKEEKIIMIDGESGADGNSIANSHYVLNQKIASKGYAIVASFQNTHMSAPSYRLKWTNKGFYYLYQYLKEHRGMIPEQEKMFLESVGYGQRNFIVTTNQNYK